MKILLACALLSTGVYAETVLEQLKGQVHTAVLQAPSKASVEAASKLIRPVSDVAAAGEEQVSLAGVSESACRVAAAVSGFQARPDASALALPLAALQNRHWTTATARVISRQRVWFNVQYSRACGLPYLGVLTDGSFKADGQVFNGAPAYYRMMYKVFGDKLDGDIQLGRHGMHLGVKAGRGSDKLDSWVVLTDSDAEDECRNDGRGACEQVLYKDTIRNLVNQSFVAGHELSISGATYRVFFANDINPGGSRPYHTQASRSLAFVWRNGSELEVYLIPAELLTAADFSWFQLHGGAPLGFKFSAKQDAVEVIAGMAKPDEGLVKK